MFHRFIYIRFEKYTEHRKLELKIVCPKCIDFVNLKFVYFFP